MNARRLYCLINAERHIVGASSLGYMVLHWLSKSPWAKPLVGLMTEMVESDPEWLDWLERWIQRQLSPEQRDAFEQALVDAKWARDERLVLINRDYVREAAPAFEQALKAIESVEAK